MDKIVSLVLTAAIVLATAASVLTIVQNITESSEEDMSSIQQDAICNQQVNNWEIGDDIDNECIDYLPEDKQDEAEKSSICQIVCA